MTNLRYVFVACSACRFSKGQYLLPGAGFQGHFYPFESMIFLFYETTPHTFNLINQLY